MVIVGAGPAGTAAAVTLARAGRDVVVVDRARFPRDKTCGDGLTAGALRLLEEMGLPAATVESWQRVDDVVLRAPSGREATFPLPREGGRFAVVAPRMDLDAALVDLARSAGAEVLEGHALLGATDHPERIVVGVEGIGEVQARYAVGADGAWSPLRKALGAWVEGYRGDWHAFRQYVAGVGPRAARALWVSFEPDLLPGYLWSFPLAGGRANVGFGVARGGRHTVRDMAPLWRDLLRRPHVRAVLGDAAAPEGPHRAWPIPARIDGVPLSAGRALFAGDAAAASDPMTGEGIGQALLTGVLAAEAIDSAGPYDAHLARQRYEVAVRRQLVPDHRLARALLAVLGTRGGADWSIAACAATPWTRRNFARWLFEDYPRAVLATPRRWHAGMFTGPGAYRSSASSAGAAMAASVTGPLRP